MTQNFKRALCVCVHATQLSRVELTGLYQIWWKDGLIFSFVFCWVMNVFYNTEYLLLNIELINLNTIVQQNKV